MRIAQVIGTVTLNRVHPSLRGGQFRLVAPQSLSDLTGATDDGLVEIVVYDELGAGPETLIAMSEGREAAQPFGKEVKPVDAYDAAILDHLHFETE